MTAPSRDPEYRRRYYHANKEHMNEQHRQWLHDNKDHVREQERKRREANREQYNAHHREYVANPKNNRRINQLRGDTRFDRKLEAIKQYGGACACCGEDRYQFLTLDHEGGTGKEHRAEYGVAAMKSRSAQHMLARLEKEGWPKDRGLRVLCANCHLAIDMWGGCPHAGARDRD